jgi:peptide deformylase
MSRLAIHYYGDPVLRTESVAVQTVTAELRELAERMIETMHAEQGIGLAAQQIGRTDAICVIDLPAEHDVDDDGERLNPELTMPLVLLNPVIVSASDDTTARDEGCLSFPDINGKIERPWSIQLRYMDLDGATHETEVHGMLARVMQHEIDHLNGVLFIDRMSHVRKLTLKGKLKRLKEDYATR